MNPQRISDYAFLSDCHSAALVSTGGSVDWWCLPRFDSPSVLGRLLGPDAGHWSITPIEAFAAQRRYVGESLVVRTEFRTAGGVVAVTDALAFEAGARGHDIGLRSPHMLLRRVEGLSGEVGLGMRLCPRPEYGLKVPTFAWEDGAAVLRSGPVTLRFCGTADVALAEGCVVAEIAVEHGQVHEFALAYTPTYAVDTSPGPDLDVGHAIGDTVEAWESWVALHRGYQGRYPEQVRRSALVLQGLTYQPSGVVLAAGTTSLPEQVGGDLNWDYRFAWLRDASLTMQAQWVAACPHEAHRFFTWLPRAMGRLGDQPLQIMYGAEGERDLTEHTLDHLAGFRDSRPVRVGNDAWRQRQLDVLGEVLNAAELLTDQLGQPEPRTQAFLSSLADQAASSWHEPDAGMWENRGDARHYTSSKVMCWVTLDRAVKLADWLDNPAAVDRWRSAAEEIRAAVLAKAWSDDASAYTGAFGSDRLDASILLLPLVGFLPADDARMLTTIHAVETRLGADGLVRRWDGDTSGFVLCSFWLVECLALAGDVEGATAWFERTASYANDLGLFAEEIDPGTGEQLGNFPQAFSHVGLVNAAWRLTQATSDQELGDVAP